METTTAGRPFDVIVWGASGHTGRLVAEQIARRVARGGRRLRWAIGGRSEGRLRAVREHLATVDDVAGEVPIVVGDADDLGSLEALAGQTRVVCSTVGPFARRGSKLVEACVRRGTDYCDTTGEVGWVRQMIAEHHDVAQGRGVRVVPFCGVDSVPSDLGCLMLHDHFQKTRGARLAEARCFVTAWRGAYSGGTYASIIESWVRLASDPAARAQLVDPYGLNTEAHRGGPDRPERLSPRWDHGLGQWVGMFLMAPGNTRVVRRTRELLGEGYAGGFSYREEMAFGRGLGGWIRASWEALRWTSMMAATIAPPTRWIVRSLVPSPGEGPGPEARRRGCCAFEIHASADTPSDRPPAAIGRVGAEVDTYGLTGIAAAEAALLLADSDEELPERFGVLTPASGLGMRYVERLRRAGMVFDVKDPAWRAMGAEPGRGAANP